MTNEYPTDIAFVTNQRLKDQWIFGGGKVVPFSKRNTIRESKYGNNGNNGEFCIWIEKEEFLESSLNFFRDEFSRDLLWISCLRKSETGYNILNVRILLAFSR